LILILVYNIFRYFRLLNPIDYNFVSNFSTRQFPLLKDYLVNLAELLKLDSSNSLVQKSILQKDALISTIPFENNSELKIPVTYFSTFFLTLLLGFGLYFFAPKFLQVGMAAVFSSNTNFQYPAPYVVRISNSHLSVIQGDDFLLKVSVTGENLPSNLYVKIGNTMYSMTKLSNTSYQFLFKSLVSPVNFVITNKSFNTETYELLVNKLPSFSKFSVHFDYPAYTQFKDTLKNVFSDESVPEGTRISWKFNLLNTTYSEFYVDSVLFHKSDTSLVSVSLPFVHDSHIAFLLRNSTSLDKSFVSDIQVIKDQFPLITSVSRRDSSSALHYYFSGTIRDDYGFSSLKFLVSYDSASVKKRLQYKLPLNKNSSFSDFIFDFDFASLNVHGVDAITYFQISDNDGINSPKSTSTPQFKVYLPTLEDIQRESNDTKLSIQSKVDESLKLAKSLSEDIKAIQNAMISKQLSSWEQKKMLNDIKTKQLQLSDLLNDQLADQMQLQKLQQQLSPGEQESLKTKQQELQKLTEDLLNNDLKDLLDQLSKFDLNPQLENLDQMKDKFNMLEKKLDSNLESFKRYKVEQALGDLQQKLEDAHSKQKSINDKAAKTGMSEDLKKKQADLSKQLDKLSEDNKSLQQQNEDLRKPLKLENTEDSFADLDSLNSKVKKDNASSTPSPKDSREKLEQQLDKMQKQLSDLSEDNNSLSLDADSEDLRQLLENLLWYSKDQERLQISFEKTTVKDPLFTSLIKQQKALISNFKIIEDSLFDLASRNAKINRPIFDAMGAILSLNKRIESQFEDIRIPVFVTLQRQVMQKANDLSLLFSKVEDDMSNSNGKGKGKSSKKKNDNMGDMKKQQDAMKKELENLLQMLKDGKLTEKELAQKLAQMFGKQEMMQMQLMQLMQGMSLSTQEKQMLNELNRLMDNLGQDLLNKRVTPVLLQRQQQIRDKLLEVEKSFNKKEEEDKKREATENTLDLQTKKLNNLPSSKPIFRMFHSDKQALKLTIYYNSLYNTYLNENK
jgi:hypothetical protein